MEMIESLREHPLKLHAKTTPFDIRDLSTHGFWYLRVQGSRAQSPEGYGGERTGPSQDLCCSPCLGCCLKYRHPAPDLPRPTVSLPGFPDRDIRNHSLPQLTCHIHLQSYWVIVFLFLEPDVASVRATCLLHKQTETVINTIIYLCHSLDPLIPGSPGTYT